MFFTIEGISGLKECLLVNTMYLIFSVFTIAITEKIISKITECDSDVSEMGIFIVLLYQYNQGLLKNQLACCKIRIQVNIPLCDFDRSRFIGYSSG